MKIHFCGAAGTTTGSQHLLEVNGSRILLDCGMYQGRREEAWHINKDFPYFSPADVDVVILSHAHIDHSGNLPNLVKKGFQGNVYSTYATRDLCQIMLADAARIQEHDCAFINKMNKRRGIDQPEVYPTYSEQDAVEDITDNAEKSILEVTRDERKSDFTPIGEAVQNELEEISRKFRNKETITGIATGFPSLDALTSGFQKGDFIIVAARPSMGKTAFVLNMAKNMSISSAHKHVAFFSLEMSREQLVQRLLCSTALIDSAKLRTGRISTQKEWDQLANAASVLMDAPLYIDDTPGVSVSEIRSKCRRLKAEQGLDIIMIDYLQLMQAKSAARSGDNRQQEISEISRSLKSLARELNVPVIALSQLSRSVEARQDHRPFLSDLRESGSLEQDADMVSFLYREAYYNREIEDDDPRKNETEIILAKNRNGPVDTVKLHFAGQFTLFYEITNQEPPPDMQ